MDEYEAENDCAGMYQDPIIVYHDAKDPAFDTFFRMGICKHPAEIYRPGNTLVLFFLPYIEDIAESNRGGKETSEQWLTAYKKGTGFIMRINRAIRNTLESRGRIHLLTGTKRKLRRNGHSSLHHILQVWESFQQQARL